MKIYRDVGEPLHEIMKAASSEQGATLLVPDLQRPYASTLSQVTLLVDSLLRGWPFGTLLLWSVHKEELAGIPSRPFWRVADRSNEFEDQQVGKSVPRSSNLLGGEGSKPTDQVRQPKQALPLQSKRK